MSITFMNPTPSTLNRLVMERCHGMQPVEIRRWIPVKIIELCRNHNKMIFYREELGYNSRMSSVPLNTTQSVPYFQWLANSVDSRFYQNLRALTAVACTYYFAITLVAAVTLVTVGRSIQSYFLLGVVAEIYETNLPPAEIRDSELTVFGEVPARHAASQFEIVMDPTGQVDKPDPLFTQGLVLMKDRLKLFLVNQQPIEVTYKSMGVTSMEIDAETIRASRLLTSLGVLFLWGGLSLAGWGIAKTVQVMIGSVLVEMIAQTHRVSLMPDRRLVIAMTALIPPMMLQLIQNLFMLHFSASFTFYIIVYGIFIFLGTRAYIRAFIPKDPHPSQE